MALNEIGLIRLIIHTMLNSDVALLWCKSNIVVIHYAKVMKAQYQGGGGELHEQPQ